MPIAQHSAARASWIGAALGTICLGAQLSAWAATPRASVASGCDEKSLLKAIHRANRARGGTVTFACRDTTIRLTRGLGRIASNVVVDGGEDNITLEYAGPFAGCSTGNNGIGGPPIAVLDGDDNRIANLTFRYFLESIQVRGSRNVIEHNRAAVGSAERLATVPGMPGSVQADANTALGFSSIAGLLASSFGLN